MEGIKVLVVDDEECLRYSIAYALRATGFIVFEAKNGHEGLLLAQKENPHIIITDYRMPGMTGIQMLKRLQNIEIIKIFCSGEMTSELMEKAHLLGADKCIPKPFLPSTEIIPFIVKRIKAV